MQSIKTRTRTKCPGTGTTSITETVTFPNCNGTKTVTETCKGGSSCSTCNGTGETTTTVTGCVHGKTEEHDEFEIDRDDEKDM